MTKKMDQFVRHWIIGERIFSWFNISPSSLPIGIVLVDELAKSRLCVLLWHVIDLQSHPHWQGVLTTGH